MGQSEEKMCEQTEDPEPKKCELRDWDFQKENKFYHKQRAFLGYDMCHMHP